MPTFKLDDQEIPFEEGDTIIRAAWRAGVEIPHYCWHPGLSIAANCRMCLVEIRSGRQMALPVLEWDDKKKEYVEATKPKLQPACQVPASEGMEVYANSEHALKGQESTQEYLLLNHPVDCPICDQAGECKLQDYWLTSQAKLKRKKTPRVHKPKGVRFGPTIIYDAERCIMCTRCIRVCDELVGDHVLDMRERGNTNEIVLSPGRELDHDYTLMTEHVCPVGALTSRDFRFKARVWFLKSAQGVCTGCATGCNSWVDYDPRYQRVYRLRPRDNEDVNQFWMCDDGMMTYKRFHEDRILTGRVRASGRVNEVPRDLAVEAAAKVLEKADGRKLAFVLSAQHPSEDNYVLAKLAEEHFGTDRVYLTALPDWKGDDILRHPDHNPNRAGAEAVAKGAAKSMEDLVADVESGEVTAVISLGWATSLTEAELAPLSTLAGEGVGGAAHVNLTSNAGALTSTASVVVPVASPAEMSGTFVNAKGMAQRFRKAISAPGGIVPAWQTLIEIGRALGWTVDFARLHDVRENMPAPQLTADAGSPEQAAPAT
ncbi:MAG TPA: 2Fe-2S iron-sulfur cluster-binding protein [Sandaracinaceae bacterium LLY-WYZ-13_1]|nr:2Fe-2S iron-sulfur cluster-binding protein [Sandaracinaceae bacterium LLY-WYZ-13_1]